MRRPLWTSLGNGHAIALLYLVRIACSLLVRTSFFNPDEYFQSLEVAHKHVFGYGHLTWEWTAGLRSYLHPLLFMLPWSTLQFLKLDTTFTLDLTARALQSAVATVCDVLVYRLALDTFGSAAASWSLLFQLLSWFNAYCLPRTYINSLEALAILFVLHRWPAPERKRLPTKARARPPPRSAHRLPAVSDAESTETLTAAAQCSFVMAVAFMARPTVAVPFGALWLCALIARPALTLRRLCGRCLVAALLGFGAVAMLDRALYGRWVLVPLEFFKFNVLGGGSSQYGSKPVLWNYYQGLPVVLTTLLPFFLLGAALVLGSDVYRPRLLLGIAWATVLPYDVAAHKEFRFLLPALQLAVPICGHAAATLADRAPRDLWRRFGRPLTALLLLVQVALFGYFGLVHQTGTTRILTALERHVQTDLARGTAARDISVLLAMPCHATPLYSWLHVNVDLRFPDCSPHGFRPSGNQGQPSETDVFVRKPAAYIAKELSGRRPPNYVVMFDSTWPRVTDQLVGYNLVSTVFHAHVDGDYGPQKRVLLFRRSR